MHAYSKYVLQTQLSTIHFFRIFYHFLSVLRETEEADGKHVYFSLKCLAMIAVVILFFTTAVSSSSRTYSIKFNLSELDY